MTSSGWPWLRWGCAGGVALLVQTGLAADPDSPSAPAIRPILSLIEVSPVETPEPLITLIETGLASWYHPRLTGRRMANGQPYRPTDFTAAHRTLPLDSHARVKNLSNGVEVVVRITDRGPHLPERVVDVSEAAARRLGLLGHGVTLVEVHSATEDDWTSFVANRPGGRSFRQDAAPGSKPKPAALQRR